MEVEIQVPDEVPVMTLPNLAFFPQALLPLHIFEPRYRQMLRDVLESNRIFAVACLDAGGARTRNSSRRTASPASASCAPARRTTTGRPTCCSRDFAGWRSSRSSARSPTAASGSGRSSSAPGAEPGENARLRLELSRLIKLKLKLSPGGAEGMTELLKSVEDPEIFADIAAFNLCDDVPVKQKLLETLDVNQRLLLLLKVVRSEIDAAILHLKLQGGLPDDKISLN